MKIHTSKLLILGSGPAGYTAAIYAARSNLSPRLVTGLASGGQLMTTTQVDNWPADAQGVLGPVLMERFEAHARRFNTTIDYDHIEHAALSPEYYHLLSQQAKNALDAHDPTWHTQNFKVLVGTDIYLSDALIISTGASAKYLNIPTEAQFMGRGVSACATCDGFFYKNQDVAVVGGGNSAVEEALYLSSIASQVHLIHRSERFRAEPIMVDHLLKKVQEGKIILHLNQVVHELTGRAEGLTGLTLRRTTDDTFRELPVSGLFVAIGHHPNTDVFQGQLPLSGGYITTAGYGHPKGASSTALPGVFAAGDCQDSIYRQAITSAASGCMAALDAAAYLQNLEK